MNNNQMEEMYREAYNKALINTKRTFTFNNYFNSVTDIVNCSRLPIELKDSSRDGLMTIIASACLIASKEPELLKEMQEYMNYIQSKDKFK